VEQGVDLDEILSIIENAYLKKAMNITGGNKSKAAEYLNLSLRSIRYRLDKSI
jgi:two-component system response regulator PilR (NtrC family)